MRFPSLKDRRKLEDVEYFICQSQPPMIRNWFGLQDSSARIIGCLQSGETMNMPSFPESMFITLQNLTSDLTHCYQWNSPGFGHTRPATSL